LLQSINLAAQLAKMEYKVALLDFDAQCSLSSLLLSDEEPPADDDEIIAGEGGGGAAAAGAYDADAEEPIIRSVRCKGHTVAASCCSLLSFQEIGFCAAAGPYKGSTTRAPR
jgi:cellulose biosynthesis protein BcsQ